MDLQLDKKLAFVSGSTAGIGYAIAARLAQEGASVMINGRSSERVQEAIASLQDQGVSGKLLEFAADLSSAEAATRAAEQFPEAAFCQSPGGCEFSHLCCQSSVFCN